MPERTFTRVQLDTLGLPHRPVGGMEVHRDIEDDSGKWTRWMELVFRAPDDQRMWRVHYEEDLDYPEEQGAVDPWRDQDTVAAVEVEPHVVWFPRRDR